MKIETFEVTYVNGMVVMKKDGMTFCFDGCYHGIKKDDGTYVEDEEMINDFVQLGRAIRQIGEKNY